MTSNVVLHLGAHRTGTTSLQTYLERNSAIIYETGIEFLYPKLTRKMELKDYVSGGSRLLISEENILGTMEGNLIACQLYPNVSEELRKLGSLLDRVDRIYLSIRDLAEWWGSAIAFCLSRQACSLPTVDQLAAIASASRGWADVVHDIRSAVPGAELTIREFGWKTDNPKQQLLAVTKWDELRATTFRRKHHNRSPELPQIARALSEHKAFDLLARVKGCESFSPFSTDEKETLARRYRTDLEQIDRMEGVHYLGPTVADLERQHTSAHGMDRKPPRCIKRPICYLHIGKTGGTFLKSALGSTSAHKAGIVLGGHELTLHSSLEKHGPNRRLAFFFRAPEERFISGFNARLRRGQPTYDVVWNSGEAAAFAFFDTPNALAEALGGEDERLCSAAHFAFNTILHLKLSYRHYLGSIEALRQEAAQGNILVCCETVRISEKLNKICASLGVSSEDLNLPEMNSAPVQGFSSALSEIALENLSRHWAQEYALYEACQEIAQDLGFAS